MLAKTSKILILSTNSIFLKKKHIYSLSFKFATSFFSKMNLKEKHLSKLKNKKGNDFQSPTSTSEHKTNFQNVSQDQSNLTQQNKSWPSPIYALEDMKKQPIRAEHETIQLTVGLNVDYRKGDQNVRGIFKMPGGSTKTPKVIAFVPEDLAEKARAAGADFIGDHETIKDIQNGQINFEKCVCTIEMLPMLKNVGRILGPLGLMPNAKIGTACEHDKIENIIKDLKLGSKEFKVDARGQIIVPVGKRDFPLENVLQNIHSFMLVLIEKKPETIKGRYFLYAYLNSRRLSYKIDMKSLDPKINAYFMNALKNPDEDVSPVNTKENKADIEKKNKKEQQITEKDIKSTSGDSNKETSKREKKKKDKEENSFKENSANMNNEPVKQTIKV